MSADSALLAWGKRHACGDRPAAHRPESMAALATRVEARVGVPVSVDEVAAHLEAVGINDRLAAARFRQPTVFALAAVVFRRLAGPDVRLGFSPPPVPAVRPVIGDALARAVLYLTPAVLALGAAAELERVPPGVTGTALAAGWAAAAGIANLGYRTRDRVGVPAATRFVLLAFVALVVCWSAVLVVAFVPRAGDGLAIALSVSTVELLLFAVAAAALVTGAHRRVVWWAAPCWLVTAAVHAMPGHGVGLVALATAVGVLLVRAYAPALRELDASPGWPGMPTLGRAGLAATTGAAQAGLFLAVIATATPGQALWTAAPLIAAGLAGEVLLTWYTAATTAALAACERPDTFRRYVRRASHRVMLVLGGLAATGIGLSVAAARLPELPRLASLGAGMLFAGVNLAVLALVCLARPGIAAVAATVAAVAAAIGLRAAGIQPVLAAAAFAGVVVVWWALRDYESGVASGRAR